jgi:hypothetical protein
VVGDALTIANTLGTVEFGVGLIASDLGMTFTPSIRGGNRTR